MTNVKFSKTKKLLIGFVAFLIFISGLQINFGGKTMSASDFTFDPQTCYITGYNGKSQDVVIPSEFAGYEIKGIASKAFASNKKITSVVIPSPVEYIGERAFENCTALITVSLPSTVHSIDESAFSGCSVLKNINIPYSTVSIGDDAFRNCTSLKRIVIPYSVESIGSGVLYGCSSVLSVVYQAQEPIIPSSFCENCKSLQYFAIPDHITEIGKSAFSGCISLKSIDIPEKVSYIGPYAYASCTGLKNIYIPSNVSSLGYQAFKDCTGLKTAVLDNEHFGYEGGACGSGDSETFLGCTNLTDVRIERNMTSLEHGRTFANCKSLVNIEIPSNVVEVATTNFDGCNDNLTIYCRPDSAALKTALSAGINYSFDDAPAFDNTPQKPDVVKDIDVSVDDEYLYFDQEPFIDDGRVMVPLRTIFEALGASVNWDDATRTVTAKKGSVTVTLQIGSNTMYKNSTPITLDVPAEIQGGRIMVPARAVSEAFDCSVLWDNDNRTVIIVKD